MNDIQKLADLIKGINIAMFSTVSSNNSIHSRPMSTQSLEFDGELWFFTSKDSEKVSEIKNNNNINISYADNGKNKYVSVSGKASIVHDQNKINELWSPILKAWFEKGKEDPTITLINVKVENAEYWNSPDNSVVRLVSFVKAVVTGEGGDMGENKTINF